MQRLKRPLGFVFAATGLLGTYKWQENRDSWCTKNEHVDEVKRKKVEDIVRRWMEVNGTPGLSLGISVDGKKVLTEGFGLADVENGTPCRSESVMRIASISKTVTAIITAKLVEEGKIELDKSIYEYVPAFPKKTWDGKPVDITVKQLLSHRGGIRHYFEFPEDKKDNNKYVDTMYSSYGASNPEFEYLLRRPFASTAEALTLFQNDPLIAKPGNYKYSTHAFVLLGACLEKVSGKTFSELAKQLFTDLGMSSSSTDLNEPIVPNRARFYRRNSQHVLVNVPEVDVSYKFAGGGILSNVHDLLSFANVLLASSQNLPGSYLKQGTLAKFWNEDNLKDPYKHLYALGWMRSTEIKAPAGVKTNTTGFWFHTGAATGASSILLIRPTGSENLLEDKPKGVCVAILANCQEVYQDIVNVAAQIAEIYDDSQ